MKNEIEETKEHLWGSISNKIDKIEVEADRLKWDAIIDMVADAFNDTAKDPLTLFLTLYQFTFRLYHRLLSYDSPQPFNQITTVPKLENHEEVTYYRVSNYDYKMFKWSLAKGFVDYTTNNYILVPRDDLSASEQRRFDQRLDKEKQ